MAVIEQLQREGVAPGRLCLDSRRVERGDIFVALRGAAHDGRAFIGDAVKRGASAILYEGESQTGQFGVPAIAVDGLSTLLGDIAHIAYDRPSEKLQVVGITGTNGKTSISQWIAQALEALGRHCAVMGTLGNGFPGQLVESPNTTPDAIAVQANLAKFVAHGAQACAMEVSSIGLDQGRVNGVRFDTAVFTNLSRDHLDYHADMEDYAAAKARLFDMPGLRHAVLNLDDPFGAKLATSLRGNLHVIGYTLNSDYCFDGIEVIHARRQRMTGSGVTFEINGLPIQAAVIGRFNVSNLLAVFGCLVAQGIEAVQVGKVLSTLTPPPGRLQIVATRNAGTEPLVVIDYAHTPDALDKALSTLADVAAARGGQLVCVFGCGGDRDAGKRPLMGSIAEGLADKVIVTSDNPRSENPARIVEQIVAGMRTSPVVELDRKCAVDVAIAGADVRDVVLLAGKGHEPYQEIANVRHPYSDLDAARAALERRA